MIDTAGYVLGVDGDSITAGEQWTATASRLLRTSRCVNVAVGSAVWYRRELDLDGLTLRTQGYGDPDFAGMSDGWLPTRDAIELQRRVNNCAVTHIERFLDICADGRTVPDLFVFAMGTNDEPCHLGDTESAKEGDQYTTAGAMYWCIQSIRDRFPDCRVFVSLPIQGGSPERNAANRVKSAVMARVARELGACVLDSGALCGIEEANERDGESGLHLRDGLHPNETGSELLGRFIARGIIDFLDE